MLREKAISICVYICKRIISESDVKICVVPDKK